MHVHFFVDSMIFDLLGFRSTFISSVSTVLLEAKMINRLVVNFALTASHVKNYENFYLYELPR